MYPKQCVADHSVSFQIACALPSILIWLWGHDNSVCGFPVVMLTWRSYRFAVVRDHLGVETPRPSRLACCLLHWTPREVPRYEPRERPRGRLREVPSQRLGASLPCPFERIRPGCLLPMTRVCGQITGNEWGSARSGRFPGKGNAPECDMARFDVPWALLTPGNRQQCPRFEGSGRFKNQRWWQTVEAMGRRASAGGGDPTSLIGSVAESSEWRPPHGVATAGRRWRGRP